MVLVNSNFYRPQTKFAKVMFFHLSVILSTGGRAWQEGHVCGGRVCMAGGHVWQGGGMCGRGACMAEGVCMAGGIHATHAPSPRHYEIWSVNARVVRILLECTIVCSASALSSRFYQCNPWMIKRK